MRIEALAAFMRERHAIHLRRSAGEPPPWTRNAILREYKFTNVFRELDRVTVWVRENIREPYADHEHLWFMLCVARYVNWPPTLAEMMEDGNWPGTVGFEPGCLAETLDRRAARGEKMYTGAYMIRAEGHRELPWYAWPKSRYIAEIVLGRLWEDRRVWASEIEQKWTHPGGRIESLALQEVWGWFQDSRYIGWGPFMAYEVVTDLRHTRYLQHAPDKMTWACAGPGALRGLNRLYNRPLKAPLRQERACEEMRTVLNLLRVNRRRWPGTYPDLEMRDVEHSLCEFDKYERVRLGEGRPRARFDEEAAWTRTSSPTW